MATQVHPLQYLTLESIAHNPYQVRESPQDDDIEVLSRSIVEKGLLQPVVVRKRPTEAEVVSYELVAGERRLLAAKKAGLEAIPAVVRDLSDKEAAELGLVENAQRCDLNPVEEALGCLLLTEQFGMNHAAVADLIGKSRQTVTNSIRILQLPQDVLGLLKSGELSAGHAKALLTLKDAERQSTFAHRAVERGLSVRALEELVERVNGRVETGQEDPDENQEFSERWSKRLGGWLGVEKVRIKLNPEGKKSVSITFDTEASWRRFVARMKNE